MGVKHYRGYARLVRALRIEEADRILSQVEARLEEAHFNAWKRKAEYVQEKVENSINGLIERTADLRKR
jgi:hypothetical protein